MTTDIVIRPAVIDDVAEMARLHRAVWCDTYRDLAPADVFRALDEDYRRARWADMLANPRKDQRVLLALQGQRLVGIGAIAAPSEPAFEGRGEVKSLYVDSSIKRQGIGRKLMREMACELAAMGYSALGLGVVVGNEPAIAFYRAIGGQLVGRYIDPGPLWRSDNLILAWDDLSLLI
ncbi:MULTISPECIES: GNAT family N-acetyltransferase [unclassified Rhizobium]|jgi:ribosomal protein S18 acetylase RimI-like enzyme|uniref:GNAT family N-acetyltransferase n=1 Tax=unclassified Rhizobium TaxID=2613769 RepID=UPI000645B0B9|nr:MULTISPECIES: GNAT family N-acetyltransferase [unclassified Rhizobium]MBN8951528.1 GNAT family N-acetyltransferase [Rhizobium tropici]OJY67735.1 MAG: GNAT family N-acetyltransferase [Rhizobium sp. 60-20]RKD60210.1 ribosomal protein S18 acetylase RimI-like enzyme [Rhizobium sp. WW_1]